MTFQDQTFQFKHRLVARRDCSPLSVLAQEMCYRFLYRWKIIVLNGILCQNVSSGSPLLTPTRALGAGFSGPTLTHMLASGHIKQTHEHVPVHNVKGGVTRCLEEVLSVSSVLLCIYSVYYSGPKWCIYSLFNKSKHLAKACFSFLVTAG